MCIVSTDLNLFWERPLLHRSQKSPRQFFYPPVSILSNWQVLHAQVMAYQPSRPENFGLENHCKGIATPTGLSCLTHNSLWYLKRRPLIDHNLFIFVFQRSAPSKERSRCVPKMKPPVWTIDTCTGAKGKRPVPTHLILTSSKSPRAQTAGFPCAQELHKSNQGEKKGLKNKFYKARHWTHQFGNVAQPQTWAWRSFSWPQLWERQQRVEHTDQLKGRGFG